MSSPARIMDHGKRARRRGIVKRLMRAGVPTSVVAEQTGLSACYVRQIAKAAGIALKNGRPSNALKRNWQELAAVHVAAPDTFPAAAFLEAA